MPGGPLEHPRALSTQPARPIEEEPPLARGELHPPIVLGPDQEVTLGVATGRRKLEEITAAIGHLDPARLRRSRTAGFDTARPHLRLAGAFLPLRGILPLAGDRLAQEGCLMGEAQDLAGLRDDGEDGLQHQAATLPVPDGAQADGRGRMGIVQQGGVLHEQDHGMMARRFYRLPPMGFHESREGDILFGQQAVGGLEGLARTHLLGQRGTGMAHESRPHPHGPRRAAFIFQLHTAKLACGPFARTQDHHVS